MFFFYRNTYCISKVSCFLASIYHCTGFLGYQKSLLHSTTYPLSPQYLTQIPLLTFPYFLLLLLFSLCPGLSFFFFHGILCIPHSHTFPHFILIIYILIHLSYSTHNIFLSEHHLPRIVSPTVCF